VAIVAVALSNVIVPLGNKLVYSIGVPSDGVVEPPSWLSVLLSRAMVAPLDPFAGTTALAVKSAKHGTVIVCLFPVNVIVDVLGSGGGAAHAAAVGVAVGFGVGVAVGLGVGVAVGFGVGVAVGLGLGVAVGLALGTGVGAVPAGLRTVDPPEQLAKAAAAATRARTIALR
jgi:hypothetical protein